MCIGLPATMELFYRVVMLLVAVAIDIPGFYEAKIQRFQEQPMNQTVTVGDDVKLVCIVENRIGAVQWTKNDLVLGDLSDFPSYAMIGIGNDFSLVITNVTKEDEGKYNCQVLPKPDGSDALRSVDAYLAVITKTLPLPPTKISIRLIVIFIIFVITTTIVFYPYHRYLCLQRKRTICTEACSVMTMTEFNVTVHGKDDRSEVEMLTGTRLAGRIRLLAFRKAEDSEEITVTKEISPGSGSSGDRENKHNSDKEKKADDLRTQHNHRFIQEDKQKQIPVWFDAEESTRV